MRSNIFLIIIKKGRSHDSTKTRPIIAAAAVAALPLLRVGPFLTEGASPNWGSTPPHLLASHGEPAKAQRLVLEVLENQQKQLIRQGQQPIVLVLKP